MNKFKEVKHAELKQWDMLLHVDRAVTTMSAKWKRLSDTMQAVQPAAAGTPVHSATLEIVVIVNRILGALSAKV